jgi:hypothetical protein
VVGAMAGFGLYRSLVRVMVQLPMAVSKISATQFRKATANSDAIRMMCIQYNEVLLSQARITAACQRDACRRGSLLPLVAPVC